MITSEQMAGLKEASKWVSQRKQQYPFSMAGVSLQVQNVKLLGLKLLNCGSCTRRLRVLENTQYRPLSYSWDFEISCLNRTFIWLLSFITMELFIAYSMHIRIYTYRGTTCNDSVHMSAVTKGKSAHNQHLVSKVHIHEFIMMFSDGPAI